MPHWIITNRRVVLGAAGREVVDETNHEPLPTFRIAKFTPPAGQAPSDDDFRTAVAFIPDKPDSTYVKPTDAVDPDVLSGTAQMFTSLYQTLTRGEGDAWFFLHGFNYSWIDSLRHLAKLDELYVQPDDNPIAQLLYFSWPSFGSITKYKSDQPIALDSGSALGRLFRKVGAFYRTSFGGAAPLPACGCKVHLGAHSMGNQVLEAFCRVVNAFDGTHLSLFGEVVLLNADADWTVLDPGEPMAQLNEYSDRTHVYCNRNDEALWISESTKNTQKRLGRHGPKDIAEIPARTVVVDTTNGVKDEEIAQVDADGFGQHAKGIIGVSALGDEAKEAVIHHWGYLYRKDVIADVKAVLRGTSSTAIVPRKEKTDDLFTLGAA